MEIDIGNYHAEKQVGTIDNEGNLETDSGALREVAEPLIEEGIYSYFPYHVEGEEDDEEHIEYREFHITPGTEGFLREFFDALPSPYDCDMEVLDELPEFDPEGYDEEDQEEDEESDSTEKEWVSDPTEEAPNRWTNTETGEHRYQDTKPGENEGGGDDANPWESVEPSPDGFDPSNAVDAELVEGGASEVYRLEMEDGSTVYFTDYSEESWEDVPRDREASYEGTKAAYDFMSEYMSELVPEHHFGDDWIAVEESEGVTPKENPEVASDKIRENSKEEYLTRALASQLLIGNKDVSPTNLKVQDDGTVEIFDLDQSGFDMTEEAASGEEWESYAYQNMKRTLDLLDVGVSWGDVIETAEQEANDLQAAGVVGSWLDNANEDLADNIQSNIEHYASDRRSKSISERMVDGAIKTLEDKDNAVTTGDSGYRNAAYGDVSGTTLDYDHWESEYMDLQKAIEEEDMAYEDLDDMLFYAHRRVVEWYPDEGEDLSKAPNMWREADNVPDFVRKVIEFVIESREVIYTSFEDLPHDAALRVKEILKDELQEPEGWSIDSLTETLADELRVDEDKAQAIARTETGAVLNTSREVAYEASPGSDDFVYYWSGANDSRTTDLCHDIKDEVEDRGGAVPMEDLKMILLDRANAYDYGTPGRVDEWMPHYNCRHTFVRDVQL